MFSSMMDEAFKDTFGINLDEEDKDEMFDLLNRVMEPIAEHVKNTSTPNQDSVLIMAAIRKLRQYQGDDIPHDFGLHERALEDLKENLNNNYPIEKYPELWV